MSTTVSFIAEVHSSPSHHSSARPLSREELRCYLPLATSLSMNIKHPQWINNPVQSGKIFNTSQGKRFVLETNSSHVIYVLLNPATFEHNRLFWQKPADFIADVLAFAQESNSGPNSLPSRIPEHDIQILSSILASANWHAFLGKSTSVDCHEFVLTHRQHFRTWSTLILTCLKLRPILMAKAPALYDRLIYLSLLSVLDGTNYALKSDNAANVSLLRTLSTDSTLLGRATGILAGRMGMNLLEKRMSVIAAILNTLNNIVIAQNSNEFIELPKTFGGKVMYLRRMEKLLEGTDVIVTCDEMQLIVNEVRRHAGELQTILAELVAVFRNARP